MKAVAASSGPETVRRTAKYRQRQTQIILAAIELINRKGIRAMTLADVAARLGMVPTGVIYYFSSKEELAAACFQRTIEVYEELIASAEAGETPAERLRLFVKGYVELARGVAECRREPFAFFNDVRALGDPGVNAAYTTMFRRARGLLGRPDASRSERQALNAVTHMVLSQLFWAVAWLPQYSPEDYQRAGERTFDILQSGLAGGAARWGPAPTPFAATASSGDDVSRETFLRAATQLINEEGYRGASVEKISARLNVTKGSFYHHNEAKDDLVAACFRRTVELMRNAQRMAGRGHKDGWNRLCGAAIWLVEHQVAGDMPLLRTSALTSAPESIQAEVLAEFNRISLSFESMISDGVADGSVRPVDAHIAAQMVTAMINAASELQYWAPRLSPKDASAVYARALFEGVGAALRAD